MGCPVMVGVLQLLFILPELAVKKVVLIFDAPEPVPPHEPVERTTPPKDKPTAVWVKVPKLATTPVATLIVFIVVTPVAKVLVPEPDSVSA